MWAKLSQSKKYLAILSGLLVILACPPISWWICIFLFPATYNALTLRLTSFKSGFLWGFFVSVVIMAGVFYWVTYVIHVFGYLPWIVSGLLYCGFCGFGALNLPLFTAISVWAHRRIAWKKVSPRWTEVWFAIGLPALFAFLEYLIPKLFPWYIANTLYRMTWMTQAAEIGGNPLLTFAVYSAGSVLGLFIFPWEGRPKISPGIVAFPVLLWALLIGFSVQRIQAYHPDGPSLNVALIQANIGSLEKRAARKGIRGAVEETLQRYEILTSDAMKNAMHPDLIVWPETAVPFQIEGTGEFANHVLAMAQRWNTAFITGAYAAVPWNPMSDYNAAYLLEPAGGKLIQDAYQKNVLLAFGEYMPLGETFPILYQWFPAVSNFTHGTRQNPFTLKSGVRLGITICYEDIIPSFFRKTVDNGVQAVINLTNDSWFGPTSEPYQHAALATFRSIENRLPLVRVTNTGISFTVDALGRMSETTKVYEEGVLVSQIHLPKEAPRTIYLIYGDWFAWLCLAMFACLLVIPFRKGHASLSI